ncbi:MAG TPA: hypothetical protein ENN12_02245 [Epsilonproteobacteria bacterium]|nr:hypothetical protein [Campylobacterota bacterium]
MKKLIFLAMTLLFVGCNKGDYPPLQTVKQVDLERYLGTWYEIARYEHMFQKDCKASKATYAKREDGRISVLNECLTFDGKLKDAKGVARVVDSLTNSKLEVSFFGPIWGDYWIIMLDEEYSYAVIGHPNRKYLWILSRTPKLPKDKLDFILAKLDDFGYTQEKLVWSQHD